MTNTIINPNTVFDSMQYGFSQAVVTEGQRQIFLSGQVAVDENENLIPGGMHAQACASLENIKKVLVAAGAEMKDVSMLRIYIRHDANSHEEQLDIANALKEYFGDHAPASSWIIVYGLTVAEWLIEIEAQAVVSI